MFIGNAQNSSAYRFLVFKSDVDSVSTNTIIESRDAEFFENIYPHNPTTRFENAPININLPSSSRRDNEMEIQGPRRSKRRRIETSFGPDYISFLSEEDPQSYHDAIISPEAPFWREAVNSEMESIMQNHTWDLVSLPPGCKTIGCKWIFKRKMKPDGSIEKYKARLVAKGYKQKEGLDFFDTYSPVTRITSIRILISLASIYKMEIHQMDVRTAFLNGELEEVICMDQPEGFIIKGFENKVCKLVKSLYGLKQAPKQWHEKFDHVMINDGFKINESDKCVYFKCHRDACVIVCLYVDDMLIFGSHMSIIQTTKKMLSE